MKALMPSLKQQGLMKHSWRWGVLGQLNQEQQSVPVPFLAALPLRSHAQVGDSTPACLTLQALEGGSSKVLC